MKNKVIIAKVHDFPGLTPGKRYLVSQLKMFIDFKTLRERGVRKITDYTHGGIVECILFKATPTQFYFLEKKYRQVMITIDRRTGIEIGGSIIGYRLNKTDLINLNKHTRRQEKLSRQIKRLQQKIKRLELAYGK